MINTTPTGAPTSFTVEHTVSEGNTRVYWSGARQGVNNEIRFYEIQHSDSPDNTTWGTWVHFVNAPSNMSLMVGCIGWNKSDSRVHARKPNVNR
jgi:hypothetical protein